MKPVHTYKALSNTIFLFGFRPMDFFIVVIGPALIALSVSYAVGFLCLIVFWYVAKKLKHRCQGYFSSLFLFVATPERLAVKPYSDIEPYQPRSIDNADKSGNA